MSRESRGENSLVLHHEFANPRCRERIVMRSPRATSDPEESLRRHWEVLQDHVKAFEIDIRRTRYLTSY